MAPFLGGGVSNPNWHFLLTFYFYGTLNKGTKAKRHTLWQRTSVNNTSGTGQWLERRMVLSTSYQPEAERGGHFSNLLPDCQKHWLCSPLLPTEATVSTPGAQADTASQWPRRTHEPIDFWSLLPLPYAHPKKEPRNQSLTSAKLIRVFWEPRMCPDKMSGPAQCSWKSNLEISKSGFNLYL